MFCFCFTVQVTAGFPEEVRRRRTTEGVVDRSWQAACCCHRLVSRTELSLAPLSFISWPWTDIFHVMGCLLLHQNWSLFNMRTRHISGCPHSINGFEHYGIFTYFSEIFWCTSSFYVILLNMLCYWNFSNLDYWVGVKFYCNFEKSGISFRLMWTS